jgi:hypothetical protein
VALEEAGGEGGQLGRGDEPLNVGFVEGAGEVVGGQDVGEVEERAGWGGDADAVVGGGVGVAGAVDTDFLEPVLCRRRDVER